MNKKLFEFSYSLRKEKQQKGLFIFFYLVIIFLVINFVLHFLMFPVRQMSLSMSPDIDGSSLIMVTPLVKKPSRGDVVLVEPRASREQGAFRRLASVAVSFFSGQQYNLGENVNFPCTTSSLRRVVGLPGDTISMRDYIVYIQPAGERHSLTEFEISDAAYDVTFCVAPVGWDKELGVKGTFDSVVLGRNEYFVLGDYRKSCDDSRVWGAVTSEQISGKALFCYFPFNKIRLF